LRHKEYQDYVIKDGKIINDFETMYQDHPDPWDQSHREENKSEKIIILNAIKRLVVSKVLEIGCGLGYFTKKIHDLGVTALGIDISETAIQKAKNNFQDVDFIAADILDFSVYQNFKPDMVIMGEITWYILEKLDAFIDFFKKNLPQAYLVHLLNIYPPDVQKYGNKKFTNLKEILSYFHANYLEYGEINYQGEHEAIRTYFIGNYFNDYNKKH
jgi:SAM-dependent methyltransferase